MSWCRGFLPGCFTAGKHGDCYRMAAGLGVVHQEAAGWLATFLLHLFCSQLLKSAMAKSLQVLYSAVLLALVPARLHTDSVFENRIEPTAHRTAPWRTKCVLITIVQSSIPGPLTVTKHKSPTLTPPYLSVQEPIVQQGKSHLLNNHVNVTQILVILFASLVCHKAVTDSPYPAFLYTSSKHMHFIFKNCRTNMEMVYVGNCCLILF